MVKKLLLLITIASNIFLFAQNKKSKKEQKETIDSLAQNGGLDMVLLQKKMNMKDVVTSADTPPEYPGGIKVFIKKYSAAIETLDLKNNEKLDVKIYFIIEKNGYITNIAALGKNKKHNEEAEKGVKRTLTRWKPATINGQPVRYLYSFPLVSKVYSY